MSGRRLARGFRNQVPMPSVPVRVAIVNDYEIVVSGVARMLTGHRDRVEVVERDNRMPVLSDVDIVLCDMFGQVAGDSVGFGELVAGGGAKVVVYAWSVERRAVERALAAGAAGYLSKRLDSEQLVDALVAIHAGEVVTTPVVADADPHERGDWPGREAGLSARESEVLALVTKGLRNWEIAEAMDLSVNSIKTYVRGCYAKLGVARRPQAVRWALENGFAPERTRRFGPS